MGTTCTIRCRYCGTQLDHYTRTVCGTTPLHAARLGYIETQMPIRCPACHARLNASREEFSSQVETPRGR